LGSKTWLVRFLARISLDWGKNFTYWTNLVTFFWGNWRLYYFKATRSYLAKVKALFLGIYQFLGTFWGLLLPSYLKGLAQWGFQLGNIRFLIFA